MGAELAGGRAVSGADRLVEQADAGPVQGRNEMGIRIGGKLQPPVQFALDPVALLGFYPVPMSYNRPVNLQEDFILLASDDDGGYVIRVEDA